MWYKIRTSNVRLALRSGAIVLTSVAVFVFFAIVFHDSVSELGEQALELYGWVPLFASFAFAAFCIFPFPDDPFAIFAAVGGMPFHIVIATAATGSTVGSIAAYFSARFLSKTNWYQKHVLPHTLKVGHLICQHGGIGLSVAALTPLPFALACWLCGATKYGFLKFFVIVAICRTIKVTYVVGLFKAGISLF